MAKIYSLVVDSDAGTECHLFTSEADRDAFAEDLCGEAWNADTEGPYPANWVQAWDVISETADWWLVIEDHEINPAKLEN